MFASLLIASALSAAPAPAATPSPSSARTAVSDTTRYCIIANITGSRIPRKICRTAADWIAVEGEVPGVPVKAR